MSDIAKLLFNRVLGWFSKSQAQRKEQKKQFGHIVAHILNEQNTRAFGPHLQSMKTFFEEHENVLEKYPTNVDFYQDWLQQPIHLVPAGETIWSAEKIKKLKVAAKKLRY